MFKTTGTPRVFALAPGISFASALADGLRRRLDGSPPEAMLDVEVYVNTARMRRTLIEALSSDTGTFLPQIRLITELALDAEAGEFEPPVSSLQRRLELSQLVRKLIEADKTRAPVSAVFDLSTSLVRLMEEMQDEGVAPETIMSLDVSDQSGHWQNSLEFFRIISRFFDGGSEHSGLTARLRRVIENKAKAWSDNPPNHPIIVAGSTGSRGATALFMKAVANLPQGCVVLPGFDFCRDDRVWSRIENEDHPQFRFRAFCDQIDIQPSAVQPWIDKDPPNPKRNALVSLALRPAPVTSEWINDGPSLGDLGAPTQDMTLLEADTPREEAEAIALRLRKAVEDGLTAALISPDRLLTRQVAAALDRWNLIPDDSAGVPLLLSPPGRLLAQLADWAGRRLPAHELLAVLKHPLANSTEGERGPHLLKTRELELQLRRNGPPFPDRQSLLEWGSKQGYPDWALWVCEVLEALAKDGTAALGQQLSDHIQLAEKICSGPSGVGSGGLWQEKAGREAQNLCQNLEQCADFGGQVTKREFAEVLRGVLSEGVVRDRDAGHPQVLIWGTLEARVQSADLVILGSLNEGTWPEASEPDPWLNRQMRKAAGLLVPERQIGLSAHDFQQAIAAPEVWITRSKRTAEAETVPSRWLSRLTNLLNGLADQGGVAALGAMRERGQVWLRQAARLSHPEQPTAPERRPSPCPPVSARPSDLSVTKIRTLIRDPYAVYAEKILRLKPLDPLARDADAPLRGILFHEVLDRFMSSRPDFEDPRCTDELVKISEEVITTGCPWPSVRLRWITQFELLAPGFIRDEIQRSKTGTFAGSELRGSIEIPGLGFKLTGIADRVDITSEGEAIIYDYKTGQVPTKDMQRHFDKQLLLEAAMISQGGFQDIPVRKVKDAAFISLKPDLKVTSAPLNEDSPDKVWSELQVLIGRWQHIDRGYTARMAMLQTKDTSPYDHLSRFGEWDTSDAPHKVFLG